VNQQRLRPARGAQAPSALRMLADCFGQPRDRIDMKRLLIVVTGIVLLTSGGALALQEDISSPKLRISWEEFKKLYDKNEAVVIDVRGADGYEAGHIPNSRSIPLDQVAQRVDELKGLKKPIVTYCA
jgi:hypothetical protein